MPLVNGAERITVEEIANPANPLSEVRARLRNYAAEPVQAGEPADTEIDDEDTPILDEQSSEEDGDEGDEGDESESGEQGRDSDDDEERIPRSKLKETDEWKSLSANMKRASDDLRKAQQQLAEMQRQQETDKDDAENRQRAADYEKAVGYIEARTQPGETRDAAIAALQERLIREEMKRFGNYLLTEQESLAAEKGNIRLMQLRSATPGYALEMADFVAEKAEVQSESLKELLGSEPIQDLFKRTPDPIGTLEALGEVLYALALTEKGKKDTKRADNRQKAVEGKVHVKGVPAAGTSGNSKTIIEKMNAIKPQDWNEFRKSVRSKKSVRAALR